MKNVTVKMSDAQAARIESIAGKLEMSAGDLLVCTTFGELGNSGFGDARLVVYFVEINRERYIEKREAPGEHIEKFLQAGLVKMPMRKFRALIDRACNGDNKASKAVEVFEPTA